MVDTRAMQVTDDIWVGWRWYSMVVCAGCKVSTVYIEDKERSRHTVQSSQYLVHACPILPSLNDSSAQCCRHTIVCTAMQDDSDPRPPRAGA